MSTAAKASCFQVGPLCNLAGRLFFVIVDRHLRGVCISLLLLFSLCCEVTAVCVKQTILSVSSNL